jgi:hypothetical protein
LAFLGFVNGLVPWALLNLSLSTGVPPIIESTYLHFWIGNNALATGGAPTDATLGQLQANSGGGRTAGPADRVRELGREALAQIREHPALTLGRRLQAGLSFLVGEQWLTDRSLYRVNVQALPETPDWLVRSVATLLTAGLLVVLVLGALGWRWSYGWRHEAMPSSLAPMWIFLPYFLSHAAALHGPRLPLDGILLCYAAFVLACLIPSVGRRLLRRTEAES